MTEAAQRRLHNGSSAKILRRRSTMEGSNRSRGRVRRQLGFCEKIVGVE